MSELSSDELIKFIYSHLQSLSRERLDSWWDSLDTQQKDAAGKIYMVIAWRSISDNAR